MATTSYSIFKPKFKKTIADAIYQEVTSKTATYYHWFGKENPWTDFLSPFIGSSAGDYPGQPSENFRYELHVRRDILTAKKIKPSDVSYVVKRIDWNYGNVYDMYDDAIETSTGYGYAPAYSGAVRLEDAIFYVLTSEFNVYKCIDNNDNTKSLYMPTGTTPQIVETPDGYRWKFMYSIPVSLRNRFLSSTYMPVSTALKAAFFSSGEINNISIESGGSGYNPLTTTAIITGDGYKESNPYLLGSLVLDNPGEGYTAIDLTVSKPFQSYIDWSSNLAVPLGSYIRYINPATTRENFYYVVSGTKLGSSGPIHTSGTINNGSCQLKYVGTTALASATLSSGGVDVLTLTDGGYGYQGLPAATITASAPVVANAEWTANTFLGISQIISHNGIYYTVTVSGTTSATAPSHTTGAQSNGTAELTYLARKALVSVVQDKTDAAIDLIITPGIDSVYTILINASGTKYSEVPDITIDAPTSGGTASAIASISGGKITIITVTSAGYGYTAVPNVTITAPKFTFNAVTDVNDASDAITYNIHRLETGDAVVYNNGGGTSVSGLTSTTTYYVIKIDDNTIQLATSYANAIATVFIPLADGIGAAHTLTLTSGIATATVVLGTGGEIVGYTVVDPGIGYTNANITINDSSKSVDWNLDTINTNTAKLVADFATGNVDTLQANVELLAVPGSIESIKVVEGGSGYGAANVIILGDGTGAEAEAICSGGKVSKIKITNPGKGYTWTDVQFTGNTGATGAVARAIMSPLGGHGSNAIDELNANSIVFYTSISRDKNQGIEINNDYRKVGLVRNFKKFGSTRRFTDDIGSGCVLVTAQFDKALIQYDMLLLKDGYKKYRVVDFTDTQLLLSVFNNFTVSIGDTIVTDPTDAGLQVATVPSTNIIVTSVSERTIDQFSGDFLMFSVREPYSPTAEQIITVRTVLTI
jgi:hypothetical protein